MKKIIDGKVYNTETATMVATYYSNGMVGYNNTYNEHFYKMRGGEIFMVHNGSICPHAGEHLELRLSESVKFNTDIPSDQYLNFTTRPFVITFI